MFKLSSHKITGLINSFIIDGRVISTNAKLKLIKPKVDKLICLAKKLTSEPTKLSKLLKPIINCNDHIIRLLMTSTFNLKSVEGSYTKIIKLWRRKGDGAHISILAPF